MKFKEDYKHRKWYEYIFILLTTLLYGANIILVISLMLFCMGMIPVESWSLKGIFKHLLQIYFNLLPLTVIDPLWFWACKKRKSLSGYGKHILKVTIFIVAITLVFVVYGISVMLTGYSPLFTDVLP